MEGITFLEDIEDIVYYIEKKKNIDLVNLSDWNPSKEFIQKLAKELPLTFVQNSISYIFSSDIDVSIKSHVIEKLGFKEKIGMNISFFDTGSLSILNIIHLLSTIGIKKIISVNPSYFTLKPLCDDLAIDCNLLDIKKKFSKFYLPENLIDYINDTCCIWITNPIYCTGTYYTTDSIEYLNKLILEKNVFVIVDESLSEPHHLLSPLLINCNNCFTIVSPHKALCTNGMKFSAILFPEIYSHIVDSWSDITTGCLSISALTAIHHYISNDYDMYLQKFNNIIEKNRILIYSLLKKYQVEFDIFSESYFLSLYFTNIPYNFFDEQTNMLNFINSTAAYLIPNNRNNFPKSLGFSFRLNLCRFSDNYLHILERAIIYLQKLRF